MSFFCYLITTTFQNIVDLVCFIFLNQLYRQVCVKNFLEPAMFCHLAILI